MIKRPVGLDEWRAAHDANDEDAERNGYDFTAAGKQRKSAHEGARNEFEKRQAKTNGAIADGPLEHSEMRAAQLVKERFGDRIRFNIDRRAWMFYSDGAWRFDTDGAAMGFVKHIAAESVARLTANGFSTDEAKRIARVMQSARGISSVLQLLTSEPGIPLRAGDLDRDIWALNVRNGTIDLRNGELRPHDRTELISKQIDIDYDRQKDCPIWRRALGTIFDGDEGRIDYLQRILGLCASGDISVQELFIWYGSGANGKSLVLETAMHCLGEYAAPAPDSLLVSRSFGSEHPTELAMLEGRRLVTTSESDNGASLKINLIKKLTGDNTITARVMRGDFYTFNRTHKTVLATNHRPKIRENGEAVWRRIRLLPFTVTIPEADRDPNLLEKLKAEAAGILAWIVRGSVARLQHGMQPPCAVSDATAAYRADSDSFGDFVGSTLVSSPSLRCTRKELVEAYRSWAVRSGEAEPLKDGDVYDAIRKVNGVDDHEWKLAGSKVRGFKGIGLAWQNGGQDVE